MSKATYPLKLPLSIKKAAQRLAKEDGVSLNQGIAVAVAEKVGVVETAAEFFKKRGNAGGAGLMKLLRRAPRVKPEPEDKLRWSGDLESREGRIRRVKSGKKKSKLPLTVWLGHSCPEQRRNQNR